jgi:hypothetical protein
VAELLVFKAICCRHKGDNGSAVEASYSKALEVSRAQKARPLELRAAGDLARLRADVANAVRPTTCSHRYRWNDGGGGGGVAIAGVSNF